MQIEYINQIRQLFYNGDIELAVQLIKSQGYELKELLEKWIKDEGFNKQGHWIFVENTDSFYSEKGIMIYYNKKSNYHVVWIFDESFMCDAGIDECIDQLYNYLTEHYG